MNEDIMRALGLLPPHAPGAGGLLGGLPTIQSTQSPPTMGGGLLAPAHMPQMSAPAQPQMPSLFERFKRGLMPTPAGLEGLLSKEDLGSARSQGLLDMGLSLLQNSRGAPGQDAPGVMQAVAGALQAGRQSFGQNTMGTLQQRVQLGELAQKQRELEQRDTLVQKLQQRYPNFSAMSPDAQRNAIRAIYGELVSSGDFKNAATMGTVIPGLEKDPKYVEPKWEDFGNYKALMAPDGTELKRVQKGVPPKTPSEVGAERSFEANQTNKILDDYRADTKDFHQVMSGWDVLKGATKDPSLATPFAITDAYARITNPGGIVRPTTMEMIDNMGSVGQRMRKYWEHNANGALPDDIMKDFQKTLYNIVREHKNQYDQIRNRTVRRGRDAGVDVSPYLQDYELTDPLAAPGSSSSGTAGNANNVRQFLRR